MANTRTIPLDILERLERFERTQWRAEVGVAAYQNPDAPQAQSTPTILERLEAIEKRLTDVERKMADG